MNNCSSCKKLVACGEPDISDIEIALTETHIGFCGDIVLSCKKCGKKLSRTWIETEAELSSLFSHDEEVAVHERAGETATYQFDEGTSFEIKKERIDRYSKKKLYVVTAKGSVLQTVYNERGDEIKHKRAVTGFTLTARENPDELIEFA